MSARRATTALILTAVTWVNLTACSTASNETVSPDPVATKTMSTPTPTPSMSDTPIPSASPTWLSALPSPSSVDRSDAEAVMRAYVITAETWDTMVDKTSAYATQRASVYLTAALREAAAQYDPDTAKGQAQFIEAAQTRSYTTVTIRSVVKEGLDADEDGNARRIVHYLVKTTPRDNSTATSIVAWDAWVTATQEDGQWAITSMQTQATQN